MPTDPDLTRPLRTAPVRREEVFVHNVYGPPRDRHRGSQLVTMPLGTYTVEERVWIRDHVCPYLVADPTLWADVLREITTEHAAAHAAALVSSPKSRQMGKLSINLTQVRADTALEYVCEHCGVGFLSYESRSARLRYCVCSNHCERRRRAAKRRPPSKEAVQRIHAHRTAQRAAARAGRTCDHCGKAIEAARSTRRFCSDICRVKAHREAAKGERADAGLEG